MWKQGGRREGRSRVDNGRLPWSNSDSRIEVQISMIGVVSEARRAIKGDASMKGVARRN